MWLASSIVTRKNYILYFSTRRPGVCFLQQSVFCIMWAFEGCSRLRFRMTNYYLDSPQTVRCGKVGRPKYSIWGDILLHLRSSRFTLTKMAASFLTMNSAASCSRIPAAVKPVGRTFHQRSCDTDWLFFGISETSLNRP